MQKEKRAFYVVNQEFDKDSVYAGIPLASMEGKVKTVCLIEAEGQSHLELMIENDEIQGFDDRLPNEYFLFILNGKHRIDIGEKIKLYFETWKRGRSVLEENRAQVKAYEIFSNKVQEGFGGHGVLRFPYIEEGYKFIHNKKR